MSDEKEKIIGDLTDMVYQPEFAGVMPKQSIYKTLERVYLDIGNTRFTKLASFYRQNEEELRRFGEAYAKKKVGLVGLLFMSSEKAERIAYESLTEVEGILNKNRYDIKKLSGLLK